MGEFGWVRRDRVSHRDAFGGRGPAARGGREGSGRTPPWPSLPVGGGGCTGAISLTIPQYRHTCTIVACTTAHLYDVSRAGGVLLFLEIENTNLYFPSDGDLEFGFVRRCSGGVRVFWCPGGVLRSRNLPVADMYLY